MSSGCDYALVFYGPVHYFALAAGVGNYIFYFVYAFGYDYLGRYDDRSNDDDGGGGGDPRDGFFISFAFISFLGTEQ